MFLLEKLRTSRLSPVFRSRLNFFCHGFAHWNKRVVKAARFSEGWYWDLRPPGSPFPGGQSIIRAVGLGRAFAAHIMSVTLNLRPEIEAGLAAQARASGMTLEEYVLSMVEGAALAISRATSPEERAAAFEAWSAGHRVSTPLSDLAVSRESMYEGHDR